MALALRCPPRAIAAGLVLGASGCGADFDPGSELNGLRVLSIEKDLPYARPGDTVNLRMLWHDSQPGRAAPQIAWLATCENPPGDLFERCFTQPPRQTGDALAARISFPAAGAVEPNDVFSFTTSPDLISSRPPPSDANVTAYGLSYVFFAACAGELAVRTDGTFPFVCYEERDGEMGFCAGDRSLDSRSFIVGYSAVFAYERFTNQNPIIHGFDFDGVTLLPADAVVENEPEDAVRLSPPDLCIGSTCTAPIGPEDPESCPEVLTRPHCAGDCDRYTLNPWVDPASAEVDAAASLGRTEVIEEQMWVNYYSAGGKVGDDVRLLNDATLGWYDDFGTNYEPANAATVSYVWAVAHDNRGGTEWARLRVCTR